MSAWLLLHRWAAVAVPCWRVRQRHRADDSGLLRPLRTRLLLHRRRHDVYRPRLRLCRGVLSSGVAITARGRPWRRLHRSDAHDGQQHGAVRSGPVLRGRCVVRLSRGSLWLLVGPELRELQRRVCGGLLLRRRVGEQPAGGVWQSQCVLPHGVRCADAGWRGQLLHRQCPGVAAVRSGGVSLVLRQRHAGVCVCVCVWLLVSEGVCATSCERMRLRMLVNSLTLRVRECWCAHRLTLALLLSSCCSLLFCTNAIGVISHPCVD